MSDLVHVDRAVARRILGGDEGAFKELFDRFFPRLYRFVLARVGNDPDTARDIVQQTFCNAIGQLDSYRGEAALYTWFCQICRNVLADHFRSKGRAGNVTLIEDHPDARAILESLAGPVSDEPETGVWRDQLHRIVEATLDSLPGRYGEVLEWKYIDGLSVAEIASRLAVGPKAAESLLTRAREAFRDAVAELFGAAEDLRMPDGGHSG
jgi:RNA polymerase sigma-70 factor (ECF subfamily)